MVSPVNAGKTIMGVPPQALDDIALAAWNSQKAGKKKVAGVDADDLPPSQGGIDVDKALGFTQQAVSLGGLVPMLAVGAANMAWNLPRNMAQGGRHVASWFGGEKPIPLPERVKWNDAVTFEKVGNAIGIGKPVGSIAQGAADMATGPVAGAFDRTGLSGWRMRANAKAAQKHLLRAQGMAGSLKMDKVPEALHEHVNRIRQVVTGVGHAGDLVNHTEISGALEGIEGALKANKDLRVPGHVEKMLTTIEKAGERHLGSQAWQNVGEHVKGMPGKLAKTSVTHGLMNASFIAGSGISMVQDGRSFSRNLKTLKAMYADMTGTTPDKVSTARVLLGKVPKPVAQARRHLIANTGAKELADVLNIGLNVKMVVDKRFSFLPSMLGFAAADQVGHAADIVMGESTLEAYGAFREHIAHKQKSGEKISTAAYADFIAIVNPSFQHLGTKHMVTQQVAAQLEQMQAGAGKVMEWAGNGELVKMGNAAAAAQKKAISAQAPHAPVPPPTHWQDVARGKNMAQVAMPVMGSNTQRLVDNALLQGGIPHGLAPK